MEVVTIEEGHQSAAAVGVFFLKNPNCAGPWQPKGEKGRKFETEVKIAEKSWPATMPQVHQ